LHLFSQNCLSIFSRAPKKLRFGACYDTTAGEVYGRKSAWVLGKMYAGHECTFPYGIIGDHGIAEVMD
jgi:hypothetical protein